MKFSDSISPTEKKKIKTNYGLEEKARFASSGAEVLTLKGNMPVEKLVEVLNRMKGVEYAGFDYIMRATDFPIDPWDGNPENDLWGMEMIKASRVSDDPLVHGAWELYLNSVEEPEIEPEVIVAVIDTGVDWDHVDLAANIWTNLGEIPGNEIDDDGNGYVDDVHGYDFKNRDGDPDDDDGHGTHCAGTIAAAANGYGVIGVDFNARIMPLKFLGSDGTGSTSDAVLAIEYAEKMGAHVINASWGGYSLERNEDDSDSLYMAITNFSGVFAAAAGNDGVDTDNTFCRYRRWVRPCYHLPSTYSNANIISVASMGEDGSLSSFSNYGATTVDLAAPGEDILSTIPGGGYDTKNGTSMATPHVAGAAALMISHEMIVNDYEYGTVCPLLRSGSNLVIDLFAAVDTTNNITFVGKLSTGGRLDARGALLLTPGYEGNGVLPDNQHPAPESEDSPEILGTVEVGTELTADPGGWNDEDVGSLSFTYEWRIASAEDEGAIYKTESGETYTPVEGEEGSYISIKVTAIDSGGLEGTAESGWHFINDPPLTSTFTTSLEGTSKPKNRVKWKATVVVSTDPQLVGATVYYSWDDGSSGTDTTGTDGTCEITSDPVRNSTESITFTIVDIVLSGYKWDGDDSTVTVDKP